MSHADLIERARRRLARNEESAEIIRELYMDCTDAKQSGALLDAFVSLKMDCQSERDHIASLTKDQA